LCVALALLAAPAHGCKVLLLLLQHQDAVASAADVHGPSASRLPCAFAEYHWVPLVCVKVNGAKFKKQADGFRFFPIKSGLSLLQHAAITVTIKVIKLWAKTCVTGAMITTLDACTVPPKGSR
jgi:hypothetical protein